MNLPPFAPRTSKDVIENALGFAPKFDADGLIPVVATDHRTGEVLMLAYMNEESLRQTIECGQAVYFSRSRRQLWHKGATSGHVQVVHEILTDCDQDSLVLKVDQHGPGCCHNGYHTCFYRRHRPANPDDPTLALETVADRAFDPAAVYPGSAKS